MDSSDRYRLSYVSDTNVLHYFYQYGQFQTYLANYFRFIRQVTWVPKGSLFRFVFCFCLSKLRPSNEGGEAVIELKPRAAAPEEHLYVGLLLRKENKCP